MKLLFKQRLFSWFDSYDIYGEDGKTVYTVEGKISWGHLLHIKDSRGEHIATVKQVILTWLPKFEIYINDEYVGRIKKEFTFFKPAFDVDFRGWSVNGSFWEWDYSITDGARCVATVSKELFNWTDTYQIDVSDPSDALCALCVVACDRRGKMFEKQ